MASTGVNVLRYSVFGAGLFYGLYHQAKLGAAEKLAAIDKDYARKQSLIDQARAEYTKKNQPPKAKTEKNDVISDPNDSNFDLEAYLKVLDAESK